MEPLIVGAVEFEPMPEGWTPMAGILLVKCYDEEAEPTWAFRTSDGLSDEELLGALTVRTDLLRKKMLSDYVDTDED